MQISGHVKTSLVDYPGQVATTFFTPGCNMRCPFCHNRDLVLNAQDLPHISMQCIESFIQQRGSTLEAVCISGGEPTLQADLHLFILRMKQLGLKVKLDTNGMNPDFLHYALSKGLLDYIAMDIKNSPKKYTLTTGMPELQLKNIEKSILLIKQSNIAYEFRTTVVKEFHDAQDFIEIGNWLSGAKKYVLQQYEHSDNQLSPIVYTAYGYEDFLGFKRSLIRNFKNVEIRGVEMV